MPCGWLKRALAPLASVEPAASVVPAMVLTAPVAITI
jgi:hypothetical protein